MIEQNQVVRIGQFVKPHGVNGEMALTVPETLDWTEDLDCLVCRMDGILVPFFLESVREKSATTLLVKFEDVNSVEDTRRFIGVTVFMPRRFVVENESDEPAWNSFLDWKIVDLNAGNLGTVHAVDDSTPNILFLVKDGMRERIIPVNEEWIVEVDSERCILKYNLPEGLADL